MDIFERSVRCCRHRADKGKWLRRRDADAPWPDRHHQLCLRAWLKTLRAVGLLSVACVASVVTARCGDAPLASPARTSPPWPPPKSLAAGLHGIFRHALRLAGPNSLALGITTGLRSSGAVPRPRATDRGASGKSRRARCRETVCGGDVSPLSPRLRSSPTVGRRPPGTSTALRP